MVLIVLQERAFYEMKNITDYIDAKYSSPAYTEIEPGIFQKGEGIVTSLSFEQEPEYGEGADSSDISQYPLEDILEKFYVYVSDHYVEKNSGAGGECCLEFCSDSLEDIKNLRTIIGKHVYNVEKTINGQRCVLLEIEVVS